MCPTHGSLSKAGKTSSLHNITWREEIRLDKRRMKVIRKFKGKKHRSPRASNRKRYLKLLREEQSKFKRMTFP